MDIKSYKEEEQEIINKIINISNKAGLSAAFLPSDKNNNLYDEIILKKRDNKNTRFGEISVQSNIGTTFTDPKEIIKGYNYEGNNILYDLVIKGIIEKGKQYSREPTFEERLDKIADDIWSDNVKNINSNFDRNELSVWAENAVDGLFTYTDDAKEFMNEATGAMSNFDYDEEEYDLFEGGREERDNACAYSIANRYIVEKLEAKFEEWSNSLKNESSGLEI